MYDLADIKSILQDEILGIVQRNDGTFYSPEPIKRASETNLSFITSKKYLEDFLSQSATSAPSVVLIPFIEESKINKHQGKTTLILVENPRLSFVKIMKHLFSQTSKPSIHPTAVIAPDAVVPDTCHIGPYTVIDSHCNLGENVKIDSHVHIYPNTQIGNNVVIMSNTVIGSDGFGYERDNAGVPVKFIHIGGVQIGDDVEIGACTAIDKGALDDTIIGSNTKIDNHVHIAHNVKIGRNCLLMAQCMIAGSVVIGDSCWISPGSSIINSITIGEAVTVGIGAVVTQAVASHATVTGNPAKTLKELVQYNRRLKEVMLREKSTN